MHREGRHRNTDLPDTFQTRFRHPPYALHTPSRHPSDTLQTPTNKGQKDTLYPPSRHLTYTFQTPSIHNLDKIQTLPNIFKGQILPILSNLCLSDTIQTFFRHLPDTLQTPFRHPPDNLHVLSRHLRCIFQTRFIISRQHSDTIQFLLDPNWAKHVKSGPSRYLPDTFQTPSRQVSDTFQTPSKHLSDTLQTPTNKGQQDTCMI